MVKVSRAFISCIIVYLLIIWAAFSLYESDLVNLDVMYKMTLLLLVLAVFLLTSGHPAIVHILVLSIYIFMFDMPQFLLYIIAPDKVAPIYISFISQETLSHALTYVLLGIITVGLGFNTGARLLSFKKSKIGNSEKTLPHCPKKTLILLFVSVGIAFICTFFLRFANINLDFEGSLLRSIFGYLTFFLNDAVMLLILFVVCLQKWESIERHIRIQIVIGVLFTVFLNFAGGSRAGLVRPVLFLFFALFAVKGDFRVSKNFQIIIGLAIVISFLMFPVVTYLKKGWAEGIHVSDVTTFSGLLQSGAEPAKYDSEHFIYQAVNRLNGLAPITAVLTIPDDFFREVISISDQVKHLINKILPFTNPFPDIIPTSRLFKVILFNASYLDVIESYHSQAYTVWGLYYAHFGWWWGLAAMYVMAFVLSALYNMAAAMKSAFNILLKTWIVVFSYGTFRGFGFDEQISENYMFFTSGIGFIAIMHFIDRVKFSPSFQNTIPVNKTLRRQ